MKLDIINTEKTRQQVCAYLQNLQNTLCNAISTEGADIFQQDDWTHPQGGGGRTRVIENGHLIEKGGINFSHIHGQTLPPAATEKRPALTGAPFQAMGISLVLHPRNPYVPTSHMNLRFITVEKNNEPAHWWFGGGFDLTPYYGFEEDCQHWHHIAKQACQPFGDDIYPKFKKQCDEYFYLKHRNEPRGIGGLFFDDLNTWGFETCFDFIKRVGEHYLKAYQPIIARRKDTPHTKKEKDFQHYRRGRYVEFNLLHDRGTAFGLQSAGRTASILMSLPPKVDWHYHLSEDMQAEEASLLADFFLKNNGWT
jgi:coproporphyrinogen III oxidase